MTAARRTLGSGRARTTNPASSTAATTGRHRRRIPTTRHSPIPAASTTATLLPDTADRCVMPVASIASVREAGVRLVSPMTRAGSNPRGSGGSAATACRRPPRTLSAIAATWPASRRRSGLPRGLRTATTSSPGSAASSRPVVRTVSCHRTSFHEASPKTSTGVWTRLRSPRPATSRTSRRTSTSSVLVGPVVITTRGSVITTASTVTVARSRVSSGTSPVSRSKDCVPRETRHRAVLSPVTASRPAQRSRRHRRWISSSDKAVRPPAAASTTTGGRDCPTAAPVHATSAGSSSRASMPRETFAATTASAPVSAAGPAVGLTRAPWARSAPAACPRCR